MAGKQKNMFAAAQQRQQEQQQIEAAVIGSAPAATEVRLKKRGAEATTITLAISKEDKAMVKSWAALHSTTVSDMLHQWIIQTCSGEE